MPSPEVILAGLTAIANDWRWLAATWHVLFGAFLAMLLAGWRPPNRFLGYLLVTPLLSVSLVAWVSNSPFNGLVFAMLFVVRRIAVGTLFPALPGVTEGFTVLAFEPHKALILGWPGPGGEPLVTWAFVLEERPGDSTRLIVRARAGRSYRFHGLPAWLSVPLAGLIHFLMQRKQLLGIARRVESANRPERERASTGETSCPPSYRAV